MDTAAEILIIILASVLTIFLIAAITVLVLVVKILKKVKHITATAENVVDSAEAVGEVFRSASGPLALFKVVYNIVDKAKHQRKSSKD